MILRPYVQRRAQHSASWQLPALCKAYDWPSKLTGTGPIAIIELGGGWAWPDMHQFFKGIHQWVPAITDISVDGTTNSQQSPQSDDDYEVALDIQIAAAAFFVATGRAADIRVYWTQDMARAVLEAAKDGCSACSISWGNDEAAWGKASVEAMEAAAITATEAGMIIFAAAGDNDSSDGGDTPANVDCPGSCPHVISCGGTTKTETAETVWNNNPGQTNGSGTGGGYSTMFPVQPFQIAAPPAPIRVPGDKDPGTGRMVPDVAAVADPDTGLEIVVYGQWNVVGGTSAVAPLYAGLFAAFPGKLGFISPKLWANQGCFMDITVGNNGDYGAAKGPDPCSGIGVVIGTKLAALLEQADPAPALTAVPAPLTHYWGG